jgi:hypothetical protein
MRNSTIATSNIERDSYIVRTISVSASDKDITFVVEYSYKEHERQKLFRRINRRLRGYNDRSDCKQTY